MTKIRLHSDLHLEAFRGQLPDVLATKFIPPAESDQESILVLAGDITGNIPQLVSFIQILENRFKKVIFVCGNHCYYRQHYETWNAEARSQFKSSLFNTEASFGDVCCEEIDGVRFVFGTLWGDGGLTLQDQSKVGYFLNDFRIIQIGEDWHRFTVQDMIKIHKEQKAKIDAFLKQPTTCTKTVVVSHHMPTRRAVDKRFLETDGSDGANGGFVGNCESILAYDHAPDYWMFGHTHSAKDEFQWKTKCLCNPTGYRGEWGDGFTGGSIVILDTETGVVSKTGFPGHL
jgi:predicted phosphodiesterase